jgi:hypothetical protein
MNDPRISAFLERLRAVRGVDKIAVRPCPYPGEPDVPWINYVLGVPDDLLGEVGEAAWTIAFEMFGTQDIPFFLSPVTVETAEEFFPEEFQRSA